MSPKLVNQKSLMLDDDQNATVFSLLGPKCYTLSTAIVQLLTTNSSNPCGNTKWTLKLTGVACLVKDYTKRSYFIRIYDLDKQTLSFELNLLHITKYEEINSFCHAIYEKTSTFGLNFTFKSEAGHFCDKIQQTLAKKSVAKSKPASIGAPFNFRHVRHVGWNKVLRKFETSHPETDLSSICPYQIVDSKFAKEANDDDNETKTTTTTTHSQVYENEAFVIYTEHELASIFDRELVRKFGKMDKIFVKNIRLPPPPPLPR